MASEFPGRPKLLKGALVAYQSQLIPGIPRVVVFQYNPESLTRTLHHRTPFPSGDEGTSMAEAREILQVTGPPRESIGLKVTLDAADQLEFPAANPEVVAAGLHPALATLELLMYPPSRSILSNFLLARAGSRFITPMDLPLSLLVWGHARVVPVAVESFSVTEEAFDQLLNPIRAEVNLDLKVLTYVDVEVGSLGHGVSLSNHVTKEVLSAIHQVKTAAEAFGSLPF